MTKQAKIREGLSRIVRDINAGIFDIPVESKGSPQTIAEFEADSLLSYLDSEGAVLRVERELPERTALIYVDSGQPLRAEDAYKLAQRDWLRAGGGFFESLI